MKTRILLAATLFAVTAAPAMAQRGSLLDTVDGKWAVEWHRLGLHSAQQFRRDAYYKVRKDFYR